MMFIICGLLVVLLGWYAYDWFRQSQSVQMSDLRKTLAVLGRIVKH
jgi:hypothetical protein